MIAAGTATAISLVAFGCMLPVEQFLNTNVVTALGLHARNLFPALMITSFLMAVFYLGEFAFLFIYH